MILSRLIISLTDGDFRLSYCIVKKNIFKQTYKISKLLTMRGPEMKKTFKLAIFFTIIFISISHLMAKVVEQDSLALIALYDSTDGNNWKDNTNWKSDSLLSTWKGIHISDDRVVGISLDDNDLTGTIPYEIGNLSALQYLYLYDNQINGEIPSEIGNLNTLLYLYLENNQLSGEIPTEIGNLRFLYYIKLDNNQLNGVIPSEIGNLSDLTGLDLSSNQLSGVIPSEIGNLSKLKRLFLDNNQLSGVIPL